MNQGIFWEVLLLYPYIDRKETSILYALLLSACPDLSGEAAQALY